MTDRELLEEASKVAGIPGLKYWRSPRLSGWIYAYKDAYDFKRWNPLEDDGDALRLAVNLGLLINVCIDEEPFNESYAATKSRAFRLKHESDPFAATRRAIVRAAAEIGSKV